MKRKAQAGIEALITIGIIIIIFIGIYSIYTTKNSDLETTELILDEQEDCLKLSSLITNTFISGPGTQVTIKTNYDLLINPESQVIKTPITTCTTRISTITTNGSMQPFTVPPGNITISNINNVIWLNNE